MSEEKKVLPASVAVPVEVRDMLKVIARAEGVPIGKVLESITQDVLADRHVAALRRQHAETQAALERAVGA